MPCAGLVGGVFPVPPALDGDPPPPPPPEPPGWPSGCAGPWHLGLPPKPPPADVIVENIEFDPEPALAPSGSGPPGPPPVPPAVPPAPTVWSYRIISTFSKTTGSSATTTLNMPSITT